MKTTLFTSLFLLLVLLARAGGLDSLQVSNNGVKHTIKVGDVVHIGYGKNPYGSFQFITHGAGEGMEKDGGGRTAEVKSIRHWKMNNQSEIIVKVQGRGTYVVSIPQAVDVGEITGFNDTYFNK